MPANFGLGLVAHVPQSAVDRVLGHRLPRASVTGEHQVEVPRDRMNLFEQRHRLR